MMKFLHTADIHLDSPLRGLNAHADAPVEKVRGATRVALEHLVSLAISEQVTFVLIAGDLYDGDWNDYSTGQFFNTQMRRLQEQGILVYLIYGNHDAESQITSTLPLPENVYVFPTKNPASFQVGDYPITIHGQGFRERSVTENLAKGYPEHVTGHLNIGILHTSLAGYEGHDSYAPCSLEDLRAKGYDYWALGHIHKREVLETAPYIIYPGSSQGRHIKETGEKGVYIVEVSEAQELTPVFHALETVHWSLAEIDVSEAEHWGAVQRLMIEHLRSQSLPSRVELHVVRFVFTGASPAHEELVQLGLRLNTEFQEILLNEGLAERFWIERIKLQTRVEVDLEKLRECDPLADFVLERWGGHTIESTSAEELLRAKVGALLSAQDYDEMMPDKDEVGDLILTTLKNAN